MASPIEKRWLCVFLSLAPHWSKFGRKWFKWEWQTIVYACSELVDIIIYSIASGIGQYSSCLYQPHYSEVCAPGVLIDHSHNSCILVDTLCSWIQLYYSVANILTIIIFFPFEAHLASVYTRKYIENQMRNDHVGNISSGSGDKRSELSDNILKGDFVNAWRQKYPDYLVNISRS